MSKTTVNLVSERKKIVFGKDNIVIQKYIAGLKGGRALDLTGFTADYIYAGHVIITDGSGKYKPMPVVAATSTVPAHYDSLPSNHSYVGILKGTIDTKQPLASIMIDGCVNSVAVPYPLEGVTDPGTGETPTPSVVGNILSAFKSACPNIKFIKDEE